MTTSTAAAAHQHIMLGPKLVDAAPKARWPTIMCSRNWASASASAKATAFGLTERQHIDHMLQKGGPLGDFESFREEKWADMQPDFETAHFLKGFAHKDGKFRFQPDWTGTARRQQAAKAHGAAGARGATARVSLIMST